MSFVKGGVIAGKTVVIKRKVVEAVIIERVIIAAQCVAEGDIVRCLLGDAHVVVTVKIEKITENTHCFYFQINLNQRQIVLTGGISQSAFIFL